MAQKRKPKDKYETYGVAQAKREIDRTPKMTTVVKDNDGKIRAKVSAAGPTVKVPTTTPKREQALSNIGGKERWTLGDDVAIKNWQAEQARRSKLARLNAGMARETAEKLKARADEARWFDSQLRAYEDTNVGMESKKYRDAYFGRARALGDFANVDELVDYAYKKNDEAREIEDIHLQDNANKDPEFETYVNKGKGLESVGVRNDEMWQLLEPEEQRVYYYWLAKEGKETADRYFESKSQELEYRKAEEKFKEYENRPGKEFLYGLGQGFRQYGQGAAAWFGDEYARPVQDSSQILSGMISEDHDTKAGKVLYDLAVTTTNMIPSMALSYVPVVGQYLAPLSIGVSAGGNAYQQARLEGWNDEDARRLGGFVGMAEALLDKVLGGTRTGRGIQGEWLKKLAQKSTSGIGSAMLRMGAGMMSEFTEEALQETLEPVFRHVITGEEIKVDWEQAAYAGMLGALSAGVFNTPGEISSVVSTARAGKRIGNAQNLIDVGKGFDAGTETFRIANKITKDSSPYAIGKLLEATQTELSSQNQRDIERNLREKGMRAEDAEILIAAVAAVSNGAALSDVQIAALERNDVLQQALYEELGDANTKANKRIRALSRLATEVATGKTTDEAVKESVQKEAKESGLEYEHNDDNVTMLRDGENLEAVNIKDIYSISNDDGNTSVRLRLDNGKIVDAKDISFASEDEAILYEGLAMSGMNAAAASAALKTFDKNSGLSAAMFVKGMNEAYMRGLYGMALNRNIDDSFIGDLAEYQRNTAYTLGQIRSEMDAKAETAKIKRSAQKSKKKKLGTVQYQKGIDRSKLSDRQSESLNVVERLAKALGIDFYVYESFIDKKTRKRMFRDENGEIKPAPNGYYNPSDSSVYLDINAGMSGEGVILYTVSHELTHFIRQWSPEKFRKLATFLAEKYAKKGVSVDALVRLQMQKAKQNRRTLTYPEAYEEFVADSMETMLTDTNAAEVLAELKQRDATIWEKIKKFFTDLLASIREAAAEYEGTAATSAEGNFVRDELNQFADQIGRLFGEGLYEASERYQRSNVKEKADERKYSARDTALDKEYMDAVNRGDMETAQRMVYEAARAAMPNSKLKMPDGRLRKVYHGTNTGDFTVFDSDYIGASSGDSGFFGRGFYFAYSEGEARFYGAKRIISAYVNVSNPFNFEKEFRIYNGKKASGGHASDAIALMNFADKFPEIAKNVTIGVVEKGSDEVKEISAKEFADKLRNVIQHKKFNYSTLKNEFGEEETLATADETMVEYEDSGEKVSYRDFGFQKRFWGTANEYDVAYEYLATNVFEYVDMPSFTRIILDNNREFTKTLKDRGYDGTIQSEAGDEVVVFDSSQIKSADPVTYDDEGNVIPLSERFNAKKEDIRYQARVDAYSYNTLTSKPDINITMLTGKVSLLPDGSINRANVVSAAKKDAEKIGVRHDDGSVAVVVNDTGDEVFLGTDGLRHSLRRKNASTMNNALVTLKAGEILKNAIRINELDPKSPTHTDTLVYIGVAKEADNTLYIVRFVVDRTTKSVETIDSLHAINTKNESAAFYRQGFKQQPYAFTDSKISVAEVLKYVNQTFPDALSMDVLKMFGHASRPAGELGMRARFQDRYSSEVASINETLSKENAKLKEDVQYLKELLKLQKKVTKGTVFKKSSVETAARSIMKQTEAKGEAKELAELLDNFYTFIASAEQLTWEEIKEQAQPSIEWLQAHVEIKPEIDAYSRSALADIRNSRIRLSEEQKKEAGYYYGSYNDYRKRAIGSTTIAETDSVSLEEKWQEWATNYPDIFKTDTNPADMPTALLDIISGLRDPQTGMEAYIDKTIMAQEMLSAVYDSYWRVSTLTTVADTYQKRINELKGKHLKRLAQIREDRKEATTKLKREYKAKIKELRTQSRAERDAKIENVRKEYQEARKRDVEKRQRTVLRGKIRRVVGELNSLLLNGTKKKHVGTKLQKVVAEALDAINMDTVGAAERIAKYDALIARTADPEVRAELVATRDRIAKQGANLQARLNDLHEAYKEIKNSEDPDVANGYDSVVEDHIAYVSELVGDTALRDMTQEQLEEVYDMYKMVLKRVRDANMDFADKRTESITKRAEKVASEILEVGGRKEMTVAGLDAIKQFAWNNYKAVYAFRRIGSKTLTAAYENLRKGEDTWARDVEEAKRFRDNLVAKYNFEKWDFKTTHAFTSTTGLNFELTLEQIMSLYAYSKRKQADKHLSDGGFVFDNKSKRKKKKGLITYKVNTAQGYTVDAALMREITSTLTEEQKAFADEMQAYLSDVMGAKGNEVTMEMYGIKLFKEKYYFPLKIAEVYKLEEGKPAGETKLREMGMTKETQKNATGAIVLSEFSEVWAKHVNDMALYHSFVLPLEDFNRIFNFKAKDEKGRIYSVKQRMQDAYGEQAVRYVSDLLVALNGGVRADHIEGIYKKALSAFKKSAVGLSLSVAIQQPSAIARALAILKPRDFIYSPKFNTKKMWENEVKKYAPVAVIKDMGRFDIDTGYGTIDYIVGARTKFEKVKAGAENAMTALPAALDRLTWCHIWNAVKRETMRLHPDLKYGTEAFFQKVGSRFTEVIERTQVYDSVFSKSANMRSKSGTMATLTAFMAENTTSINMVNDAFIESARGNKRAALNTLSAVAASIILNGLLVSFVRAMRDDDEDKTYWEKYAGSVVGELAAGFNPLTYIPFLRDVWSIMQGYDVARTDMSVVRDAWDSVENFMAFIGEDTDDLTDEELEERTREAWDVSLALGGTVAMLFGIPLKNLTKDVKGIINTVKGSKVKGMDNPQSLWDSMTEAAKGSIPLLGKKTPKRDEKLYNAIIEGNTAYRKRLEAEYKDEDAVNSAIRSGLRKYDERVRKAAEALYEGDIDKYDRLRNEIVKDGFEQDLVVSAIKSEEQKVREEREGKTESESKSPALYDVGDYFNATTNGNAKTVERVKKEFIDRAIAEGNSEKDAEAALESSYVTECKKRYLDGDLSEKKAVEYMQEYGGKDKEEAETEIKKWKFESNTGYSWGARDNAYRNKAISASKLMQYAEDIDGEATGTIGMLYVDGDISATEARKYLQTNTSMDEEEVEKQLKKWKFEVDYEYSWADKGEAYKAGKIKSSQLEKLLVDIDGKTEEEAALEMDAYDWQKQNPQHDLTVSEVKAYIAPIEKYGDISLEDTGLDVNAFLEYRERSADADGEDKNGDGKADNGTVKAEKLEIIDSLPITNEQKDALYFLNGWARSKLRRAPWH